MNNQPKGEASSNGRGVPIYCLWVCPADGGWEAVHSGPYQDCYSQALATDQIYASAALTIQPVGFNPNS
jgi:hypothetical protein